MNTNNSFLCPMPPTHIQWTGFALAVEFIGLARAAALVTWFIRKCLPENFTIPYNREVEDMLRAAFDDVQNVRTLGM